MKRVTIRHASEYDRIRARVAILEARVHAKTATAADLEEGMQLSDALDQYEIRHAPAEG